ncbi:MAG TPA: hypothetical protein VNO43_10285 [Candidatus Eisenbacteria bacterium]|nr:hypothetical protein [Candidatus Eisenbacteria bacterium]
MKYAVLLPMACVFLAACAAERDRVLYQKYAGYNYCHTKIETSARDPVRPGDRTVVDHYGACDDRPSTEQKVTMPE